MPRTPKVDPPRTCQTCGQPMFRKRFASGRLEDRTAYLKRQTCSLSCGNTRQEVTKGAHHIRARKHIAAACQDCATTIKLHVHHIDRNPSNNDPANLLTLCSSCHLKLHWREDREQRLTAIRGASSRKRSTAGSQS
jgi:5-methylcytosine-specific restriction endonuclease McrA